MVDPQSLVVIVIMVVAVVVFIKGSTPISAPTIINVQIGRWFKEYADTSIRITFILWNTKNSGWWWIWWTYRDSGGGLGATMVDLVVLVVVATVELSHQRQVPLSLPKMHLLIVQQMGGVIRVDTSSTPQGGGGAGSVGENGDSTNGGDGGQGITSDI